MEKQTTKTDKNTKNAKKDGKILSETLLFQTEHIAEIDAENQKKASEFCEGYKKYLDKAKTEYAAVETSIEMLKKAGFKEFDKGKKYKAGDKIYVNNREKALVCAVIGTKSVENGVRLVISHVDAPRLDLKPNPLYEDSEFALFKTHYYGGVRKYQWGATPLSIHGVVYKADGTKVTISMGEDEGDAVFCITDLLPHLAQQQSQRKLAEGLKGEELNIMIGSIPFEDKEVKNRFKLYAMQLLNEKYGITERDFTRAELQAVPAFKAKDVGLDRSMIGAYGQDDRICAYTSLMALLNEQNPEYTNICVLTDKEETGSNGTTGLQCDYTFHFLQRLANMQNADYITMLENSKCLSADVNVAMDPTFGDVSEKNNCAKFNHGVIVTKYTGSRGKGDTNDADAKTVAYVTKIFDDAGVTWQTGELGKVDQGGGGTIAKYVANRNVDVIDIGVPILSMHAPFELSAKLDVYMTYKAFCAFAASAD